jgi:serine/threonine-protein kinase
MATDLEETGRLVRQSLEIRRRAQPRSPREVAEALAALARYHDRRGELTQAQDLMREALGVLRQSGDERQSVAILVRNNYATILSRAGSTEEAAALQREAIALANDVFGPDTLPVANLLNNYGNTLASQRRFGEAEGAFRDSLTRHVAIFGEPHWRVANVARNLGVVVALQQRYEEALAWLDRAVAGRAGSGPGTPQEGGGPGAALHIQAQRAIMLLRSGRGHKATTLLEETLSAAERLGTTAESAVVSDIRVWLARVLTETGRAASAERHARIAVDGLVRLDATHPKRAEAECEWARARLAVAVGADAEARATLARCAPAYVVWPFADPVVVAALNALVR